MTLPIARELARNGVRMMTIAPGIFGAPMLFGMPKEVREGLGTPKDFGQLGVHIHENDMLNGEVTRRHGAIRLAPK